MFELFAWAVLVFFAAAAFASVPLFDSFFRKR